MIPFPDLKIGVEIHQQLLTDKKLFCRCPTGRYSKTYDSQVLRHMRPTLSEMGTYDGTALMEFKTKKEVIYLLNKESVCTYEMDDTPPFLINQQALDIAIEIALAFGCHIIDELHVARKQYLDRSIPTGFQRTAIVGVGGSVPFKDREIRIQQVNIEEDACREVSDIGHTLTLRTDRLGTPLVEIITFPDMHTPEEAAEAIELLGRVMKSTRKVRRGIGSVRQDVNVSISGGTRIEIKGVPKIGYVPKLVENEALRQKALLELRDELQRRGISANTVKTESRDLTTLVKEGGVQLFRQQLKAGERVTAIKLSGLGGLLNYNVQSGRTFADEIAGRVRVIACLDKPPILMHTDGFPKYQNSNRDLAVIRRLTKMGVHDAVVICRGSEEDVNTALDEIRIRVLEAFDGVPSETRQRLDDGNTDFERILPGPDRMYPDTDHRSVKISEDRVQTIRNQLPEKVWEREARYRELGLPQQIAREMTIHPRNTVFDRVIEKLKLPPKLAAVIITQKMKAWKRQGLAVEYISNEDLFAVFSELNQGKIDFKNFSPRILKFTQ